MTIDGQAEKGSLLQQNELEKSRQRMDAKRHIMGDLLFRSKRAAEDARTKREELCYEIRWLLVASKTLSVARQQLQVLVNSILHSCIKTFRDQNVHFLH